jgi:hypothetical protein
MALFFAAGFHPGGNLGILFIHTLRANAVGEYQRWYEIEYMFPRRSSNPYRRGFFYNGHKSAAER